MTDGFAAELAGHGDAPALLFPGRSAVTYAELAERVGAFARDLGCGKRLIAVEAACSEPAIVAYLAALRGGHAVAMLPPGDEAAWASFVERFRPDAVFRRFDGRWRLEETIGQPAEPVHRDLALILVTSGSTGHGKAVRLSSRAVASNAAAIAQYLDLGPQDRGVLLLPLHYSYGLSVLNSHLAVGASLYLPGGSILDAGFVAGLRENACTNIAGVPYSYDLLEAIGFRDEALPNLRFMTVAGGRLTAERLGAYRSHMETGGGRFFVMYGQTEATARIAYVPPEHGDDSPDRIGVAIPGGELGLCDEAGAPIIQAGTVGELVYRGLNVMMGYAETRSDLALGAEIDVLRTGDLAILETDGFYRIVGRLRRMSKIAGQRIGHDALEAALAAQGIEAAVVGDDKSILAVYTSAHTPQDVRERLVEAAKLGQQYFDAVAAGELPRLATGKVDYEALKRQPRGRRQTDAAGIAEAFRETFYPHAVTDKDSFVSLSGDSLRHVEMSLVLEQRLGRIPNGWERMSIRELAALEPQPAKGSTTVGVDLVIRAAAILLVVIHHATLWPISGGSTAMVVLIGYGLARFQKGALIVNDFATFFRPLIAVLAPYYLIVTGYALAWGTVPWASVFLVGNVGVADPVRLSMLPYLYWFVEAYAQILLVWAGVFLFPRARHLAASDPFRLGMALLAAALVARFLGPMLWPIAGREIFSLPWVFYLAVFGWCAAVADTRARRLLVAAAAVVVMPIVAFTGGNWIGSWMRYELQFAVIAALLYCPRVTLPTRLATVALPIAAAGYHIYLFHRFVPEVLLAPFAADMPPALLAVVAVTGGVAMGFLAYRIQKLAISALAAFFTGFRLREAPAQVN